MKIENYLYRYGTEQLVDRIAIPEIDNTEYMTCQYIDMLYDELAEIKAEGKVALLYVGGVAMHNAETSEGFSKFRCSVEAAPIGPVIKRISAYMMHQYAGILVKNNNIVYANINGNTCAGSIYALYEAEMLLTSGKVDSVIIIAEEKTSKDTLRIFKEHNIDLEVGEGFALVVLSNRKDGMQITDTKWEYEYDRNPFKVTEAGYNKVYTACDIVKGHKTGTEQNDSAEIAAFGEVIGYKDKIGHCQGASGLIELCMMIDDNNIKGKALGVASGLGNFYGSYILHK